MASHNKNTKVKKAAKETGIALERWELSKLKAHPLQAVVFTELDETELQELVVRLKKGQKDRIDILPDGTIICGHQRVKAAKLLRWKMIEVRVRHDLASEGPEAVERELIEDNFVRRQLDPLARARAFKHLHDLEQSHDDWDDLTEEKESLRDRLGKRFSLSGRTVDRYLNALKAPKAVQDAVSAGKLALTLAAKVGCLLPDKQQELADAIEAGNDPKETVTTYLSNGKGKKVSTSLDLALEKRLIALEQELASIRNVPRGSLEILRRLQSGIQRLLDQRTKGRNGEMDEAEDVDWEAVKKECRMDLEDD